MPDQAHVSQLQKDDFAGALGAVAKGDRAAFRLLYDGAGPVLFRVCLRLLRDREAAREALQESMVRIWQKSHLYDPAKGDALGWMVAVARNCVFNRMDERSFVPLEDDLVRTLVEPRASDPGAAADIRRCLGALSEKYRKCVMLIYHFGLSYEELANRMAAPLNTVKTWVHRAVGQLGLCLER